MADPRTDAPKPRNMQCCNASNTSQAKLLRMGQSPKTGAPKGGNRPVK